jgi:hypothetical protein
MKLDLRYLLLFSCALVGGVYLHEIGHAIAGWLSGVAIVPTPAKEYILRPQLDWSIETRVALGGPIGTTAAALVATLYFLVRPCSHSEAILTGAFVPLGFYSLRFALVGRGHDGTEWQAAQAALGLRPAGHAIDIFFLCLLISGLVIWGIHLHPPRQSVLRITILAVAGIILLLVLQAGNNAVFDHLFPATKIVGVPLGLDVR